MKFKVNRLVGFAVGTLSLAVVVGVVFVATPAANAIGPCSGPFPQNGRGCEDGYFTNINFGSGFDLWTGGLPTSLGCVTGGTYCGGGTAMDEVNGFIAFVEANKTSAIPREVTSAEYVIDTQEGFAPGTRGEAWNAAVLADWETRLRKGVQDGTLKIDWNNNWAWGCGQLDTMYAYPPINDISAYYTFPGAEIPSCGVGVHVPVINFIDVATGKIVYQIKRTCGNPIGKIGKLPDVPYSVVPGGTLVTNNIPAGSTDTLNVTLDSKGPNESDPGTMQVGLPGNINNPGSSPGPGQVGLSAYQIGAQYGFHGSTAYGGDVHVTTPDWYWNATNIPSGKIPTARFKFTISAAAPPGVITFWVCFNPASQAGNTVCNPVNLTVVSERQPVVVGNNGDVHAGGGICGSPLDLAGKVSGYGGAGDETEYVVSATGTISNFGSNQGNGGGQDENLGTTGGYQPTPGAPWPAVDEVCREDLLGTAEQYLASGGTGYGTITNAMAGSAASPLNVSSLNAEPVYYYNGGGTLHLKGQVNNKVTIVAESGTVEIDGNININPAKFAVYPKPMLPSLGIIAANDINISLAATNVDAYLFSNATIDTCLQGVGNKSGCVGASLTVNGFLMANNLLFQREGAFNVDGNPVTETITLNPQIYLDPPEFFDSSVDNTSLQGQGEKPPLY